MFQFEPLHAYALCGASSLVAAGMLALAKVPDANTRAVQRHCVAAFAVLGAGLFPLTFGSLAPSVVALYLMVCGTVLGTALLARAMAAMCGKDIPSALFYPLLAAVMVAVAIAQQDGRRSLALVMCVSSSIIVVALLVAFPRLLVGPSSRPERMLGGTLLVYAASWIARTAATFAYEGPLHPHLLYLPSAWVPWLAMFYTTLPVFMGSLVLNTVNARLTERLTAAAMTDELTGALSRRALQEMAPAMAAAAMRQGHAVAVVMIDLDHFKAVNDRYGHAAGDAALCAAALACRANLRAESLFTRHGGEEFVALMPVDAMSCAVQAAERLRRGIAETPAQAHGNTIALTASIGVALWPLHEALDVALQRADAALYRAKAEGRNRVCEWTAPPGPGVSAASGPQLPPASA